jgi:hypothetical protein
MRYKRSHTKLSGEFWFPKVVIEDTVTVEELAHELADETSLHIVDVKAILMGLSREIYEQVCNGKKVELGDLAYFAPKVETYPGVLERCEFPNMVKSEEIKGLLVRATSRKNFSDEANFADLELVPWQEDDELREYISFTLRHHIAMTYSIQPDAIGEEFLFSPNLGVSFYWMNGLETFLGIGEESGLLYHRSGDWETLKLDPEPSSFGEAVDWIASKVGVYVPDVSIEEQVHQIITQWAGHVVGNGTIIDNIASNDYQRRQLGAKIARSLSIPVPESEWAYWSTVGDAVTHCTEEMTAT